LKKGQEIKCLVLEVDEERHRVSLGVKQLTEDPWLHAIPDKYIPGQIIKGKVTKLTNFGAFVELEPDLEGLLHISEIADHKIEKPRDIVKLGDEIEVKILRVDTEARKIGLSLRRVQWAAEEQASKPAQKQTPSQTVLSDADVDVITEPQEKTDEPEQTTSDSSQPTEQQPEPAETEPAETEPAETEPAETEPVDQEQPETAQESEKAQDEKTDASVDENEKTGDDSSDQERADN
jgi:small subunit ribosomal protein S1